MAPEDLEPRVEVTSDGPYEVRGTVRIVRTAPVETEYGEPIAWTPDEALEAPTEDVRLCRCGRSATKPFCDDSHLRAPFDGTEVADRGPYDQRATRFDGEGIALFDDLSICTKAGFCGDRFTTVWRLLEDADDPDVRERIRHMTSLCPSGRIVTQRTGAGRDEPPYEPTIAIEKDGPVWVRGWIPVVAADGETYEVRNRQTLCRCGGSGNKPFCDGTHRVNGFRDG